MKWVHQLKWSKDCFLVAGTKEIKITDTKLYIQIVILSTEGNIRLLKQLESGFKITINWNKYQYKAINQAQNKY